MSQRELETRKPLVKLISGFFVLMLFQGPCFELINQGAFIDRVGDLVFQR
jgi:hypothetical protein